MSGAFSHMLCMSFNASCFSEIAANMLVSGKLMMLVLLPYVVEPFTSSLICSWNCNHIAINLTGRVMSSEGV